MRMIWNPIRLLTLILWIPLAGFAQVSLDLSRSTITMDDTVDLTLRVEGGLDRQAPDIPLPDGLVVSGMSKQFMSSGSRREDVVVYEIQPTRPGDYTLGPYNLNLPGGQQKLPAMSLTVTPAKVVTAAESTFVTLESSANRTLVRQTVELTLGFYSQHSIGNIEQIDFDTGGFRIGDWREIKARSVTINDEPYRVRKFINRLTPVRAGDYELAPVFKVQVIKPGDLTRHPFGMMTRQRELDVLRLQPREPLVLEVTEPPAEGRPDSYAGHIGTFHLNASLSPREVSVGDPITLRVQLSGTGSLREALPPTLEENDDFKVYEPRLVEEDLQRDGLSGRKVFEQVVIPTHADIREVPALEFGYFNPESESYQVETAGPFSIEVTGSSDPGTGASTISSLDTGGSGDAGPVMLGEDLVYLKSDPGDLRKLSDLRPGRGLVGAAALPFALWGLTALVMAGRERRGRDPEAERRRRAPRRLRRDLAKLEDIDGLSELYARIWDCLSAYLTHRLGLPPGDLDPKQAAERLPDSASPKLREELADWMSRCERVRFAGAAASPPSSNVRGDADTPGAAASPPSSNVRGDADRLRRDFTAFMLNLDRELGA